MKNLNAFPILESDLQVVGYQIDSRMVGPGDLFFALPGERVDGHRFLGGVKERGGVGAVVEKEYLGPDFGLALIRVEGVEKTLQEMARKDLEESGARVIGVTGSVGKTTTKDFLKELLKAKYRVGSTPGNYNTRLSLPLSILNREGGEEVFVLEMGISQPGGMERLLGIAQPEVAVVTKVALSHAAFFPGGLEEIAKEKAQIFKSPKLRLGVYFQELSRYHDFQGMKGAGFSLEDKTADYYLGLDGCLDVRGLRAYQFDLPFQYKHLLHNFLAAAVVAKEMGIDWDAIQGQIPNLKMAPMRLEKVEQAGIVFINDAYNANPESMKAAFCSLPDPEKGGKRIAVLGAMTPLGTFSHDAHVEVGRLALESFDMALVLGEHALPLFATFQEKKPAEFFTDLKGLASRLKELASEGDVVLVKGSRDLEMERLFDDPLFC